MRHNSNTTRSITRRVPVYNLSCRKTRTSLATPRQTLQTITRADPSDHNRTSQNHRTLFSASNGRPQPPNSIFPASRSKVDSLAQRKTTKRTRDSNIENAHSCPPRSPRLLPALRSIGPTSKSRRFQKLPRGRLLQLQARGSSSLKKGLINEKRFFEVRSYQGVTIE